MMDNTSALRCPRRFVVMFATFVILFIVLGFNITILYQSFLQEFQRSTSETSLIQSVNFGTMFCISTVTGICVQKFGPRTSGLFAGGIYCVGIFLSSFATSIFFLIVTLGILTGIGMSGTSVACTTVIGQYFTGSSRPYALSFAYFGSGLGAMTFTYFGDYLINEYGWRGCLTIISAITANLIPCFLVCKPKYETFCENATPVKTISVSLDNNFVEVTTTKSKIRSIVKNLDFLLTSIGLSLAVASINSFIISVTDILSLKGFTRPAIILLLMVMQVTNTLSRLGCGLCKRIPHVSVMSLPAMFSTIGFLVFITFPSATVLWHHFVLLSFFGVSFGGTMVSMSLTTFKTVREQEYPVAFGILMTMVGIMCVTFGPILGYLRAVTGSYTASLYSLAVCHGVAIVMFVTVLFRRKRRHRIYIL